MSLIYSPGMGVNHLNLTSYESELGERNAGQGVESCKNE